MFLQWPVVSIPADTRSPQLRNSEVAIRPMWAFCVYVKKVLLLGYLGVSIYLSWLGASLIENPAGAERGKKTKK